MMPSSWRRTPPVGGAVLGHFAGIGLSAGDLPRLVDEAIEGSADPRRIVWRDSSGATFYVHRAGDEVACLTPFFRAPDPALWRVRTCAPLFDSHCTHCGGADCDVLTPEGSVVTRAAVQWTSFREALAMLRVERTFDLAVVAFAHRIAFADSLAELAEHQRSALSDFHLADASFMAFGMAGPSDEVTRRARARFSGRTEAVSLHVGGAGRSFLHLRIRSIQGPIDVVVDGALGEGATDGRYAMVEGWLVGRPTGVGAPGSTEESGAPSSHPLGVREHDIARLADCEPTGFEVAWWQRGRG